MTASGARVADLDAWFEVWPTAKAAPRLRLICLPPAGDGPRAFAGWTQLVPAWLEMCLVKLPGRGDRIGEPLPADLSRLVKAIARRAAALIGRDKAPYAVFGHSVGAILAYELVVTLQARSVRPPVMLVVSGAAAPEDVVRRMRAGVGQDATDQDVPDLIRELGPMAEQLRNRPDLLQVFTPAIAADTEMLREHHPSNQALECPLFVFRALADPHTDFVDVGEWRALSRGEFAVRVFSGGHHYPTDQPHEVVAALVELAQRYIPREEKQ